MVLKTEYAKLDDIPDDTDVRDSYIEKGGKWVLNLPGVKTEADVKKVQESLKKERDEHKATKEKFAPFAELGDLDEVKAKLERIPELETAAKGKLNEADIEKIVAGRVETKLKTEKTTFDRELKKVVTERDTFKTENEQHKAATVRREIRDDVAVALKEGGVVDTAQDDVLILAERIFERVEGKTVTKDGIGVTPGLDAKAWLAEVGEKKPHWFAPSKGGGAKGGPGGSPITGAANPWSHEGWNLTNQGKFLKTHGEEKAKAMAKAVGVDMARPMRPPAPKK